MIRNLTRAIIIILTLCGCNASNTANNNKTIPDTGGNRKNNPSILKSDSVISTGFYLIKDSGASIKRQLVKTNDTYGIDEKPIVTAINFDTVSSYHEKDCYALFIWLDKHGSQLLDIAKHNYKGEKIAFIVGNKLVRTQLLDDPQFAQVDKHDDQRTYGQILAFPCNSFSPAELEEYETIINNDRLRAKQGYR